MRITCMVTQNDDQTVLDSEQAHTVQSPRLYRVLLLNDDYTPMDFVVDVLRRFFAMDKERATTVMLQVHHEGQGLCGVYPRDIAATKVDQVSAWARQHQHPLACVMEENG